MVMTLTPPAAPRTGSWQRPKAIEQAEKRRRHLIDGYRRIVSQLGGVVEAVEKKHRGRPKRQMTGDELLDAAKVKAADRDLLAAAAAVLDIDDQALVDDAIAVTQHDRYHAMAEELRQNEKEMTQRAQQLSDQAVELAKKKHQCDVERDGIFTRMQVLGSAHGGMTQLKRANPRLWGPVEQFAKVQASDYAGLVDAEASP